MEGHRTAERRSIAYHAAIAGRLVDEPAILERATKRLVEWRVSRRIHERWIEAWIELLERPIDELRRALVATDERMTALRQVTPFAGTLDARTRWAIWRSVPN